MPLRVFGPLGTIGFTVGSILLIGLSKTNTIVGTSTILIGGGILIFCFGMFGELVSFANAKQVEDYNVKTFLNTKE